MKRPCECNKCRLCHLFNYGTSYNEYWIGLLKGINKCSRQTTAILMESKRLRNEFNGTDQEYKDYLLYGDVKPDIIIDEFSLNRRGQG
jgi:hypothetical protein